jgi:hypothetical protein
MIICHKNVSIYIVSLYLILHIHTTRLGFKVWVRRWMGTPTPARLIVAMDEGHPLGGRPPGAWAEGECTTTEGVNRDITAMTLSYTKPSVSFATVKTLHFLLISQCLRKPVFIVWWKWNQHIIVYLLWIIICTKRKIHSSGNVVRTASMAINEYTQIVIDLVHDAWSHI